MDDYPELDDRFKRIWESLERDIRSGIFQNASTSTSASTNNEKITLEKMQEMIDRLFPPLYYGTATHIERGTLYYIKESDDNPEYIVFHPDDFESVKTKFTARRLVHLKDEPQETQRERLLNKMRRMYGGKTPEELQKIRLDNLDKRYQEFLAEIVKNKP